MIRIVSATLFSLIASSALADEIFSDDAHGGKLHISSNFTCPARLATFERDAVGERNPQAGSVYCAYSKLDGVYGTIMLTPIAGPYDARASLATAFEEAQSTGGRSLGDTNLKLSTRGAPLSVYSRTYETAKLLDAHYRALYTGAAVGNWAVELTIEYADPRDTNTGKEFLAAAYAAASAEIGMPAR